MRVKPISILLLCAVPVLAGDLSVRLANGADARFSTRIEPEGTPLPGSLVVGDAEVHRLIEDKQSRFFLGYDLWLEPVGTGQCRVIVKPLRREFQQGLLRDHPGYRLLELPGYPEARVIRDGDTVEFELMVNRATGARLVDVIRAWGNPETSEAAGRDHGPSDYALEDVRLEAPRPELFMNGASIIKGEKFSLSAAIIWFGTPDRGRFVLSVAPRPGYDFQKIGVIDGHKLRFSWQGTTYELISRENILGPRGPWNLWVLNDPGYRQWGMGAADRIESVVPKK